MQGGRVDACRQVGRGVVVSGGVVSHPSRQQSGGVGTGTSRPYRGCNGRAVIVSMGVMVCDDASGARSDPRPGTVPGMRASSGGVLEW